MKHNLRRTLAFSEAFVTVEHVTNVEQLPIDRKTAVVNLADAPINIAGTLLNPLSSSVFSSVVISRAARLLLIPMHDGSSPCGPFPHASDIIKKWTHVHEIFHLPHLEGTKLWRSIKEKVDEIEFNLWFAAAGTDCGIHNEHDFRELHTQVFGVGRMQKFHDNDPETIYQEVFMAPGYTHEPFYDQRCLYPWHQYYSDTDCLWLAVELSANQA